MDNKKPVNKKDNPPGKSDRAAKRDIAILKTSVLVLIAAIGVLLFFLLHARHTLSGHYDKLAESIEHIDELEKELDSLREYHIDSALLDKTGIIERSAEEFERILSSDLDQSEIVERLEYLKDVEKDYINRVGRLLDEYRDEAGKLQEEKGSLSRRKSQVSAELERTVEKYNSLKEKNEQLQQQIEKASLLTISELKLEAINVRGREEEPTKRARSADKIRVCFAVNENHVAKPGYRNFYIRFINPDNNVLAISEENTFEYRGEDILYSIKIPVDYQNEKEDMCIAWDEIDRFLTGYYKVTIHSEGRQLGYQMIELE